MPEVYVAITNIAPQESLSKGPKSKQHCPSPWIPIVLFDQPEAAVFYMVVVVPVIPERVLSNNQLPDLFETQYSVPSLETPQT